MDAKELYKKTEYLRKHNKNIFFNKIEMSKSINQTVLNFLRLYDQS